MKNKNQLINKIYNIVFISLTFIIAILFILFAYTIYSKGKAQLEIDPTYQIYTREIVTQYLNYLIIPLIIWILTIISGIFISKFYPLSKKKKVKLDPTLTYTKLRKRISNLDNEEFKIQKEIILKQRKNRKIAFIIISILTLICFILPARYLFNPDNFLGVNSNEDVLNMSLYILPFIIIVTFLLIGYSIYYFRSLNLEIDNLLEYLVKNKDKENKIEKIKFYDTPLFINSIRGIILLTGITFVILGIFNKGFEDVLQKAINICSECIGLA